MTPGSPRVLAAGAVLWRPGPAGPELAVVHRPRYDDWSLPKGKPEADEHLAATAVREVEEETGLRGRLGRPLGSVSYDTSLGLKTVRYWTMQAEAGGGFSPNDEVDTLVWLDPEAAAARLTYPHDADVVQRALAAPLEVSTVLLVRHARAGDRHAWTGPDEQRPLDDTGRDQARALAPLLGAFGPTDLRSADRVRCVQTLEPLAAATGLPLRVDGRLDDDVILDDPAATAALLRSWSGAGTTTVACSQGEAIPAAVGALCRADGVRPARPRLPARKGSVWVLSFADNRLLASDYLPDAAPCSDW